MSLFLKSLHGKIEQIPIDLNKNSNFNNSYNCVRTVRDLKLFIKNKYGIPCELQRLICAGKYISKNTFDNNFLLDFISNCNNKNNNFTNICDFVVVQLLLGLNGGSQNSQNSKQSTSSSSSCETTAVGDENNSLLASINSRIDVRSSVQALDQDLLQHSSDKENSVSNEHKTFLSNEIEVESFSVFDDNNSTIVLVSSDNMEFELTKTAARMSALISNTIDSDQDANNIVMKKVEGQYLNFVVEYLKYHNGNVPPDIKKPIRSVKMAKIVEDEWDAKFIDKSVGDIFQIILAANYMDIKSLLHLGCAKIATLIKGKSPDEIKQILHDKDANINEKPPHKTRLGITKNPGNRNGGNHPNSNNSDNSNNHNVGRLI